MSKQNFKLILESFSKSKASLQPVSGSSVILPIL